MTHLLKLLVLTTLFSLAGCFGGLVKDVKRAHDRHLDIIGDAIKHKRKHDHD